MKKRIDILLVEKNLVPSRERAQSEIMAGNVFADGKRVEKAGDKFFEESVFEVKGKAIPYVSRGGLKLEKALSAFEIKLEEKVCIDVGASTGGFTDCMLKNGAQKVFAIDVGYGQLAWSLRQDPRVVCMERTNIRYVESGQIGEYADFACIDVSFISLLKVIPIVVKLLKNEGRIVCLVKPQFEAGKDKVGKKGVVRDKEVHIEVLHKVIEGIEKEGLAVKGLDFSPIKGPEGNIEYLLYIAKKCSDIGIHAMNKTIENLVDKSHCELQ